MKITGRLPRYILSVSLAVLVISSGRGDDASGVGGIGNGSETYIGGTLQASGNFVSPANETLESTGFGFDRKDDLITATGILSGSFRLSKAGGGTLQFHVFTGAPAPLTAAAADVSGTFTFVLPLFTFSLSTSRPTTEKTPSSNSASSK